MSKVLFRLIIATAFSLLITNGFSQSFFHINYYKSDSIVASNSLGTTFQFIPKSLNANYPVDSAFKWNLKWAAVSYDSLHNSDANTGYSYAGKKITVDSVYVYCNYQNITGNQDTIVINLYEYVGSNGIEFDSSTFDIINPVLYSDTIYKSQSYPANQNTFKAIAIAPGIELDTGQKFTAGVQFWGDTTNNFRIVAGFKDKCNQQCAASLSAFPKNSWSEQIIAPPIGPPYTIIPTAINQPLYDCDNNNVFTPGGCERFPTQNFAIVSKVSFNDTFRVNIQTSAQDVCPGETIDLSAEVKAGSGNYSYQWTPSGSTPGNSSTTVQVDSQLLNITKTFAVQVVDNSTQNIVRDTITIGVQGVDASINTGQDTTIVCGDSLDLSASASGAIQGGVNYHWVDGSSTPVRQDVKPGSYAVTVSNSHGCRATASTVVHLQGSNQNLSFDVPAIACEGTSTPLTNTSTRKNGWNFTWQFDGSNQFSQIHANKTYSSPGNKIVTLSADSAGCEMGPVAQSIYVYDSTSCPFYQTGTNVCHIGDTAGKKGFYPSSDSFNCFVQGMYGREVIKLKVGIDTTPLSLHQITIDSINNLPCGLHWTTNKWDAPNPNRYSIMEAGCIEIAGVVSSKAQAGTYAVELAITDSIYFPIPGGIDTIVNYSIYRYLRVKPSFGAGCPAIDTNQTIQSSCPSVEGPLPCPGFSVSTQVNDVNCGQDLSLIATVNGGTSPFMYSWSNGPNNDTISGLSANPYSLTVISANGCTATASDTISDADAFSSTLNTAPVTTCNDSNGAITVDVTGGTTPYTYAWNNGQIDSSLTGLTPGTYTVTITDANGCSVAKSASLGATGSGPCVWPGDANHDGVVNNNDLLKVGVAHGNSGPQRATVSTTWTPKDCNTWPTSFNSGLNHKYGDCNGDGVINHQDTLAIIQNYSLTHNKTAGQAYPQAPPVSLDIPADSIFGGETIEVPVKIGSSAQPVSGLYGIAFTIQYNADMIEQNSLRFVPSTSWLGSPAGGLLSIYKDLSSQAMLDIGITRTNQQDGSGSGSIGHLEMTMAEDLNTSANTLNLSVSDVRAINAQESSVPLQGQSDSATIYETPTSIDESEGVSNLAVYPNPAHHTVTIDGIGNIDMVKVQLINVLGQVKRIIQPDEAKSNIQLQTGKMQEGIYFMKITLDGSSIIKKLIISK